MAARTPVLDKTDLFGTLPPELLEQLRGRTALARYRRGDAIFEKGDPATQLYVCFSGRVAIVAKATDGRESVLTVLGPGALFGEMSTNTVPDELVQAATFRLAPDRVARAKVRGAEQPPAPESSADPSSRPSSVPKPRSS